MGLYLWFENFFLRFLEWLWKVFIWIHEMKNIYAKRRLWMRIELSEKQKKQIDEYYLKHYGKKVKYWWHRLYTSYTGKFDYQYIPEYIYSAKIEPKIAGRLETTPFENKNVLHTLFDNVEGVTVPETYFMKVGGVLLDQTGQPISEEKAYVQFSGITKEAVVKKSIETSSGRDVKLVSLDDGVDKKSGETLKSIVAKMGKDLVVQEKIVPDESLARLYPNAINTLRVITYICEDSIKVAPLVLRIGQGDAEVDNAHAGGMFVGISEDGELEEKAFTEYGKEFVIHPDTNVVFKGYRIPKVRKICEKACIMHRRLPQFGMISWDITLAQGEQIVLIEMNLNPQAVWLSQIAHGRSMFGENTPYFLKLANKKC